MARNKPTLGYGSRREAILALADMGYGRREIVKKVGVSSKNVAAVLWQERRERIPAKSIMLLLPEAKRRGITAHELARRLLVIVAKQGLVGAVLDDRAAQMEAAE